MERNFIVNMNSIDKLSNELRTSAYKIDDILDYLIRITGDMDTFFDTPSSKILREGLTNYLVKSKTNCQTLSELSNYIKLFNKNYSNMYDVTKQSVGDEL